MCAVGFGAIFILIVYFALTTVVAQGRLNENALAIIDFQQSGLYFNYDLPGYGMMALATLFAGLTIKPWNKVDKWLRRLLVIHGVFFPA